MEETQIERDITENATIVEEGPRICPLCNSIVKPFFVNFNQKIMMCENIVCEFPFCENLNIYKEDVDQAPNFELLTIKSKPTRRGTSLGSASAISASEWSDIDRLSQAYESEDNYVPSTNKFAKKSNQQVLESRVKRQQNEEIILQNVEKIKEYNKVLFEDEGLDCIRNEKWIRNLFTMQTSSGMQLLKEQELQKLKQKKEQENIAELKIDIEARQDSMSSIKIQIGNNDSTAPDGDKSNNKP